MPCTTTIIRHFAPSVSIIADDVDSVLSHCATTMVRCNKMPIAISSEARLISTLPRRAHLVSLPHAPSQQIGPSDLENALVLVFGQNERQTGLSPRGRVNTHAFLGGAKSMRQIRVGVGGATTTIAWLPPSASSTRATYGVRTPRGNPQRAAILRWAVTGVFWRLVRLSRLLAVPSRWSAAVDSSGAIWRIVSKVARNCPTAYICSSEPWPLARSRVRCIVREKYSSRSRRTRS